MKKLLYIAHRLPYPPDKGERIRAYHALRLLAADFHITLAALTHGPADPAAVAGLAPFCRQIITAPVGRTGSLVRAGLSVLRGRSGSEGFFHSPQLRARIRAASTQERFDLALGYSSSMLPYLLAADVRQRIMDLVDADSAKWSAYADRAAWPKTWLYRREAHTVGQLEQQALARCQATVVTTPAEKAVLGPAGVNVIVSGMGVDTEHYRPGVVAPASMGPASLVFTGTMDYLPNADGVAWFAAEVWPALKRRIPDLTFYIVGRNPTPAVQALAGIPGIVVTGAVADVRPYLLGATLAICPLRIARGVQSKILEAMACGRATVVAPAALQGLEVQPGRHVIAAQGAAQWQQEVESLLTDTELRMRVECAARLRICEHFTWTAQLATFLACCRELSAARCAA